MVFVTVPVHTQSLICTVPFEGLSKCSWTLRVSDSSSAEPNQAAAAQMAAHELMTSKVEPLALGTLEATDTLRRGHWLGLPLALDVSTDDDLKASRNAPGHSGRRIPHPLSQTRLPTAATSNSQEMCEHELSAERTGLAAVRALVNLQANSCALYRVKGRGRDSQN